MKFASDKKIEGSFEDLCKNETVIKHFLTNMTTHAKSQNLAGFEVAKVIHLTPTSMVLSGICTPSMKVKRNDAKKFY